MTVSELKQEVLNRIEKADEQMLLRLYSILSANESEIANWWDELDSDVGNSFGQDADLTADKVLKSSDDALNELGKWV